ncbi:coiled-coil domain-containing protein 96 [Clonorchis sinensis]|uniref:Coiled-coil domain-containing protein 96 n=1 Tax=Clonorchis sinensis TaxID=79923 RepID=H2KVV4_CLOSI|nr:coiled-coil domain-containing protein 96 [Clonorchis sinensis]
MLRQRERRFLQGPWMDLVWSHRSGGVYPAHGLADVLLNEQHVDARPLVDASPATSESSLDKEKSEPSTISKEDAEEMVRGESKDTFDEYNLLVTTQTSDEEEESSVSRRGQHTSTDEPSYQPQALNLENGTMSGTAIERERNGSEASLHSASKQEARQKAREELIDQYRQAVMDHKVAREANLQLQTKLAEYFRRKKADAAEQQSGASSMGGSTTDNVVDYEQRYNKYISSLTELRNQYQQMQSTYQKQIEELKAVCAERQKEVDDAYRDFTNYKYNVGKKALHGRTGRPINPKDLLAMLNAEQKKEAVVMEVRLENIKLRNEVAKIEAILKSKEELAEGLHLIDFEQLKIENQTYNEKIEERNEELGKLKRKIASTVQIMTHVKEKLQAVQYENAKQRQRLAIADAELTFNRDQLAKLKKARDRIRMDNSKLRRSCGLLGKTALLLNYEDSVDAVVEKKAALEQTKKITAQYQTRTKGLIEKIEGHAENMDRP